MMKSERIFDTDKKRKEAVEAFTNLKGRTGWKILKRVIDENIEILESIVLAGGSGDKNYFDTLRDRIELFKFISNLPEQMIEDLQEYQQRSPELDPYSKAKELRERSEE